MGNCCGCSSDDRRQQDRPVPSVPQPQIDSSLEISGNQYVFAAVTPYPSQFQNANQNQANYNPVVYNNLPMPDPSHGNWVSGQCPNVCAPTSFVEQQKAITIRNDVNMKKETLRMEPDEQNPKQFLVAFTFDATAAGSITVLFFGKEGEKCSLLGTNAVTVPFKIGVGQKYKQPLGTGIELSAIDDSKLVMKKEGEAEVFPLMVMAEANPMDVNGRSCGRNCQLIQAAFEKKEMGGGFHVRVMRQILWVNQMRYELQEIYGIGNSSIDSPDLDGKDCVICLCESRNITALPCRHMCMCSGCAQVLRFQTNRCPICRQPLERLLEINVKGKSDEHS